MESNSKKEILNKENSSLMSQKADSPTNSSKRSNKNTSKNTPIKTTEVNNSVSEFSEINEQSNNNQFEYSRIKTFIDNCLTNKSSGSLYISGLPGSGKTATLLKVLENYSNDPKITYIYINNANHFKLIDIFVQVGMRIFNQKIAPKKIINNLDVFYRTSHQIFTLLVIDKFDNINLNEEKCWKDFSEWASLDTAKIIFIACSNALDVPKRLIPKETADRFSFTRIYFNSYDFVLIQNIIHHEIVTNFERNALVNLTQKVSSFCGDYRKAFKIAEKALEIAKKDNRESVQVSDVDEAFKSFSKPREVVVKSLQYQSRVFLKCLIEISINHPDEPITIQDIYKEVVNVYKSNGDAVPTIESIVSSAALLQECGIISHLTKVGMFSKIKGNFLPSCIDLNKYN